MDNKNILSPNPSLREGSTASNAQKVFIKPRFDKNVIRKRGLICSGNHLPYNPNNKLKAKELRKNMTKHEKMIRQRMRKQKRRALRQHTIDHYIVDFYVASAGLVIEIDGASHFTQEGIDSDSQRTEFLEIYNLKVMRFTNNEVQDFFDAVCESILIEVQIRSTSKMTPS